MMDRHTYRNQIMNMALSLDAPTADKFMNQLARTEKNPVVAYGFNAWLGWLGADRFYVGDILLGILKLVTLGGCGFWILLDYFIIGGRTRVKNINKANRIYDTLRPRS